MAWQPLIERVLDVQLDVVGSGDQRNTIWGTVELEGDRDGTHGTPGLVCCPESGTVASVETWAVVERDQPGIARAQGIDQSTLAPPVTERTHYGTHPLAVLSPNP